MGPAADDLVPHAGPAPEPERRPLWVVSFSGICPYGPIWDLQRRVWWARQEGSIPDVLLFLEHEPVVTLGRNARRENLLLSTEAFRERGTEVVEIDRGGDVTWHGPGQLVGYWIFDLRELYLDVHRFLREIEETLIRMLARHGVVAARSEKATGVWIGGEKVAAMGLHLSRWVSTHGFALNLNNDLEPFTWIVPCGLRGRGVTSLARLSKAEVDRARVEAEIVEEAAALFRRAPRRLRPEELRRALEAVEARRAEAPSVPAGRP